MISDQGKKRSRVDEDNAPADEKKNKSLNKSKFIYGNYDRYYGYRVRGSVAVNEMYACVWRFMWNFFDALFFKPGYPIMPSAQWVACFTLACVSVSL